MSSTHGCIAVHPPEHPGAPDFRTPAPGTVPPRGPHRQDGAKCPDLQLPQARQALLGDGRDWPDHPGETPAELKPFLRAFGRLRTGVGPQFGGHAAPVQGPVEYGITSGACGSMHAWGNVSAL